MMNDNLRQILIVLFVVATIVVNAMANALPFNGLTTAEISDRFDIFFVPAGYVFSIWGLIYVGLIAFAIYQALPGQKQNQRLRSIGYPFLIASVANIVWLFLWHYEVFSLTLLAMITLLGSLIVIYLRTGVGRGGVSRAEFWTVRVPFSLYLGWITVATIANATQVLDYANWGGWGISEPAWTVIMLVAAAAIAATVLVTRRDPVFVLVVLWAFAGIALKHQATRTVALSAWALTAVLGLLLLVGIPSLVWRIQGAR
jgi:hypothetical protein